LGLREEIMEFYKSFKVISLGNHKSMTNAANLHPTDAHPERIFLRRRKPCNEKEPASLTSSRRDRTRVSLGRWVLLGLAGKTGTPIYKKETAGRTKLEEALPIVSSIWNHKHKDLTKSHREAIAK